MNDNDSTIVIDHSTVTDSTAVAITVNSIYIIDWEFVTYAPRYVDLAHFAAECWLYDHFYPSSGNGSSISRQLTSCLFKTYRASGGIVDMQKVIYYIASHIGCFLDYSTWTEDPAVQNATAKLAVKMIEDARERDWVALKEDGFLTLLFEEGDGDP